MVKRLLRELGLLPKGKAGRLRREGNQNRDAGLWEKAAEFYQQYLRLKPKDLAVWIQYGHVLLEAGRARDAIDAHRRSVELFPESTQARNHLLRVLIRAGDDAEAMAFILDTISVGQSVDSGLLASTPTGGTTRPARTLPTAMTLYSVQDLIGYLHHHATLSGIQRVQAGIARYLIDEGSQDVGFILSGALGRVGLERFALIGKAELAAVIDYATGSDVQASVLQGLLVRCSLSAEPVEVGHGHTLIVLGAFWALGSTPKTLWPAKRAGAKVGVYIYDLIPLTHPQFCVPELTRDFCRSLSQMLEFADFFLTISDHTRFVLRDLMLAEGLAAVPMATVPLAHELTRGDSGLGWPKALADMSDAPFVAYVSTVEGRKNHIYIVRVWQRLIQEGVDVPHLVFVGRRGWRNDALYRLLEETDDLSGKVRIVHDLDDAELNGIYAKALFTVFTSFVEGWGLPVGESLMHGTPCVASNTSSIPEVGEEFVDYVDPTDIDTGVEVVRRMITQGDYLEARRSLIKERFQPRSWHDVGRTFAQQVERQEHTAPRVPAAPRIAAGDFVLISPPSRLEDPTWYFSDVSESLVRDDFYDVEPFGAWMRGQQGIVRFRCDAPPGTPVLVYLSICTSDPSSEALLTVRINQRDVWHQTVATLPNVGEDIASGLMRVEGQVDVDGMVAVQLALDGPVGPQSATDTRAFAIGLRAVGVAQIDGPSRADLLESLLVIRRPSKSRSYVEV